MGQAIKRENVEFLTYEEFETELTPRDEHSRFFRGVVAYKGCEDQGYLILFPENYTALNNGNVLIIGNEVKTVTKEKFNVDYDIIIDVVAPI